MSITNPIKIFAENLSYLRNHRDLSQAELAKEIGVSDKTILRYEGGAVNPKMDIVVTLANALNVRIEDFFNDNLKHDYLSNGEFKIKGVSNKMTDINYREEGKIPEDLKLSIKNITIDRLVKIHELFDLLRFDLKFTNPLENFKVVRSRKDAEKAAIRVRRKWELGNSPIFSVINTLENQGVNIIELDVPGEFEGLSAYINQIPVIVLNTVVSEKTRRRFTALHELGHLILEIDDDLDYVTMERICDAFAAAMLLPKELLIVELGEKRSHISSKELKSLKEKYGISVRALLVGAAFSEIIEWDEYREMKDQLIDLGQYEGEERSTKYEQLVFRGIAEGQLSPGKAKYFSGITSSTFNQIKNNLVFG